MKRKDWQLFFFIDSADSAAVGSEGRGSKAQTPRSSASKRSGSGDQQNSPGKTTGGARKEHPPPPAPAAAAGQSKPSRAPREGKRALYPSKAVIQYPKIKLRPPPPAESPPPQPSVTTTVVRGADTLLVSICRKPDQCLVEPAKIDTRSSPFKAIITLTESEALNAEVEAEQARPHPRPTPLSCFSPPKWALLDTTSESHTDASPGKGGKDGPHTPRQTASVSGERKMGKQDGRDKSPGGLSPREEAKTNKSGADGVKTAPAGEKSAKATKSPISSSKTVVGKPTEDEDAVAKTLIKKYLSFTSDPADKGLGGDGKGVAHADDDDDKDETWPPMPEMITDENRGTYVLLSEQLRDAKRLMDMPERRRERRLWKLPVFRTTSDQPSLHPQVTGPSRAHVTDIAGAGQTTQAEQDGAGQTTQADQDGAVEDVTGEEDGGLVETAEDITTAAASAESSGEKEESGEPVAGSNDDDPTEAATE